MQEITVLSDDGIATHRRMAVLEFLQKHIRRREGFSKGLDKGFAKGERNAKSPRHYLPAISTWQSSPKPPA
ncbi:Rpn family recombination-promoting nuclease/putative transposase [Pseudocitrobacter sp. RIT415]|uniref:Rpn family recombination-promoting nuclease/putative transposase n=1 Tax=Pseudocitrobacter sp. RIT415 TaxID=2202163 RepID=UPI001314F7ED|nr:Rpn family recombination-promoting nuclease/putative transposase [Pseudocitrobacter sp. RIT 415]